MNDQIQGTFHFHSKYSHDGKSSLAEIVSALKAQGFSFCVMTEHFEDFDAAKFDCYLQEVNTLNQNTGFILVPGMEVHLSGLDTIIFPVNTYAEIAKLASGAGTAPEVFKVLAHPSKYPFEKVARHLEMFEIQAVELWNQQADGSYHPPLEFLESMNAQPLRNQYRYFFGCDLHDASLTVRNVLSLASPNHLTFEAIARALIEGDFVSQNRPTGISYLNGSERDDFDTWLQTLHGKPYYRGKLLRGVRNFLKSVYKSFPRKMQHSLNDIKNFVRNKV